MKATCHAEIAATVTPRIITLEQDMHYQAQEGTQIMTDIATTQDEIAKINTRLNELGESQQSAFNPKQIPQIKQRESLIDDLDQQTRVRNLMLLGFSKQTMSAELPQILNDKLNVNLTSADFASIISIDQKYCRMFSCF